MEIKCLDQKGLDFIAKEEGLRLKPYLCSAGVATIGYGSTYYENDQRVKLTDPPITKQRALELFKNTLKHYEQAVWSNTRDDINQSQFNALVALSYNIGVVGFKTSTVLRKVNANPSDKTIAAAFEMWSRAGEDKNRLRARRKREAALYFS
jgi:lysozyme